MFFDDEFDDLFNGLWNKFNRPVLDQKPFKAYSVEGKGYIIVVNALGIDKENVEVRVEKEKGAGFPTLKIKGATDLPKINFKNSVDMGIKLKITEEIEKLNYEVKNGLITIYISVKKPEKNEIKATCIDDDGEALDW